MKSLYHLHLSHIAYRKENCLLTFRTKLDFNRPCEELYSDGHYPDISDLNRDIFGGAVGEANSETTTSLRGSAGME